MEIGKATGRGWQRVLALAVAPHMTANGHTIVSLGNDGTIHLGKTYAASAVAFSQRTRVENITSVNTYVVTRRGNLIRVYTGPAARLFSLDMDAEAPR